MSRVRLRTNTEFNGEDIYDYQLRDSEIVWDQIHKCLVVKGYKDNQLYTFPAGGVDGTGGVTDHTLLTSIGYYTHYDIDTHIDNEYIHYYQDEISITESQISNLKSYIQTSNLLDSYSSAPSDSNVLSEKFIQTLLANKSDIDHIHSDYVSLNTFTESISNLIPTSNINIAYGVAGLDASGKVSIDQLPTGIVGGLNYKGLWDPNVNTQELSDNGVGGINGDYYKVSTASDIIIDNNGDWYPGDWIIHNGNTWDKLDNTDTIFSVNGYVGNVTLTKNDLDLGNVNNTSDINKPLSTATIAALASKEDSFIKNTAFNKNFGTDSNTVAYGNHTHSELHTHLNNSILDSIEVAFTNDLNDKLSSIDLNANYYVHPTGNGNSHVPFSFTENVGDMLVATSTAGVYAWQKPISSHLNLSDIGIYSHEVIDNHLADNTIHIPTSGNNNPNKVLTSTDTEGVYLWQDLGSISNIVSDNVTINPNDLINSNSDNIHDVLVDFDSLISNKILLGEYAIEDIIEVGNTMYVCMEDVDGNWIIKKVVELVSTFEITYANINNNSEYTTYTQAKDNYSILIYSSISSILPL